jgi:hypothetical protein
MEDLTLFSENPDEIAAVTQKAIKQAQDHADRQRSGWSEKAYDILENYLQWYVEKPFRAEDFIKFAESNGLEKPAKGQAYGGTFQRAANNKLITSCYYIASSNKQAHGRPTRVWRKLK